MPEITNTIRLLRTEMGLTQEQLGQRLGVSRQTIIAIEAGKYTPSLSLALRLGREFGQSIESMFTLNE